MSDLRSTTSSSSSTTTGSTPTAWHTIAHVPGRMMSGAAARAIAVLRIATGFIFLWAFLDKLFGLGYSTTSSQAWIHGGSPTQGFLANVGVGPLQSFFHNIAGTWWADWGFMLGLLGLGVLLIAGIGVRISAVGGAVLLAMMWFAEFPLAKATSAGAPTGSTNPLVDYHLLYAVVLIVIAMTFGGDSWGLGRVWARIPLVAKHGWLR